MYLDPNREFGFEKLKVKPCTNTNMAGYTLHEGFKQITHCPNLFSGFPDKKGLDVWRPSLLDLKNDQTKIPERTYIGDIKSIPGHFVHELTHLLQSRVGFPSRSLFTMNVEMCT